VDRNVAGGRSDVARARRELEPADGVIPEGQEQVLPIYPELALPMGIAGEVTIAVVMAPSEAMKSSNGVGGHPVPAPAALEAIRRWRFEPAASSGVIEFKFAPSTIAE